MGSVLGSILAVGRQAITPATDVMAANQAGQMRANQQQLQNVLQRVELDRQARQDALTQAIGNANIHHLNTESDALARKPTNILRGPGGQLLDVTDPANPVSVGPGPATKPVAQGHVVDPVTGRVQFFDPTHPPTDLHVNPKPKPEPQSTFSPFQGTDDAGKPVVRPFNTKTGKFGPPADVAPKASVSGGAASNQFALRAKSVLPQFDQAASTLDKYDEPGAAGRLFTKNALGSYAMSPDGQNANQAALQLARAYLSSQSTRIAPAEQIRALANEILIQPGEEGNPVVVANKRARRATMRQEILTRAGLSPSSANPPDQNSQTGDIALSQSANPFFRRKP